jgi:phage gpG-like protein
MPVRREGKLERFAALASSGQRRGLYLAGMVVARAAQNKAPRLIGRLKRSLTPGKPFPTGTWSWAIHVGTNVIYAAIHEFGGVIVPRVAKMLAIPIGDLQGSPRRHDLHIARTKGGAWLLIDQAGKAQYVLKQSVTIPARPYLRPALREKQRVAAGIILKSIFGALRGMGK